MSRTVNKQQNVTISYLKLPLEQLNTADKKKTNTNRPKTHVGTTRSLVYQPCCNTRFEATVVLGNTSKDYPTPPNLI